jgi:hypothetical protein
VISKYKTGKHFDIVITDTSLTVPRRQAQIDEEAAGFLSQRGEIPLREGSSPMGETRRKFDRDFRADALCCPA